VKSPNKTGKREGGEELTVIHGWVVLGEFPPKENEKNLKV